MEIVPYRYDTMKIDDLLMVLEHIRHKHGNIVVLLDDKNFKRKHIEILYNPVKGSELHIRTSDWYKHSEYD